MIKNEILERRIAQLISQTYAISCEKILSEIKQFGIEATIQQIEEAEQQAQRIIADGQLQAETFKKEKNIEKI